MSAVRSSVEWLFSDIINDFKFHTLSMFFYLDTPNIYDSFS